MELELSVQGLRDAGHQQSRVASSEENNDSSTVPDDALRSFPPLDRHRLASYYRKLSEEYEAMAKLHEGHAAELRKKE